MAQELLSQALRASIDVREKLLKDTDFQAAFAAAAAECLKCVSRGGTIYACGNGGSACDAMHLAEELVARYKRERPGIKAMHFLDAGTISCWSNDYSYDSVFARQVSTFCTKNDLLVLFSTSGNSKNLIEAAEAAKKQGTFTLGLLGKGGGKLKDLVSLALVVPCGETERIQEIHITLVHALCEHLESR